MTTFRNAYHFVPRKPNDRDAKGHKLPEKQRDFGLRPGHESEGHAIYAADAHSGRITCRITLECPTIIGGQRKTDPKKKEPAKVAPFLFKDKPAIPASSLKGMLSLIAESAARAPYRVLRDMQLTVAFAKKRSKDREETTRFTVRHVAGTRDGKPLHSKGLPDPGAASQLGTTHAYFHESLRPMSQRDMASHDRNLNPVESMFGFIGEAPKDNTTKNTSSLAGAAGKLRISHALPSGEWAAKDAHDLFLKGDIEIEKASPLYKLIPEGVTLTLLKEQGEPMKKPKRLEDHKPESGKARTAGFSDKGYEALNSATPNFYFVTKKKRPAVGAETEEEAFDPGTGHIQKQSFATTPPDRFAPQGAKFYLHNPDSVPDSRGMPIKTPWRTLKSKDSHDGIDRKAAAPILRPWVTFDFHVDFDNLTDHELNILCFALRPSERFRHKIGLGKALGLGSIKIDVTDLVLIDRKARYSAASLFKNDPRDGCGAPGADMAKERADTHDAWLSQADPVARKALLALGETHDFDHRGKESGRDPDIPVLWVPLTEQRMKMLSRGQLDGEDNSYEWFMANDMNSSQKLRPITDDKIPTLEAIAPPPRSDKKK